MIFGLADTIIIVVILGSISHADDAAKVSEALG